MTSILTAEVRCKSFTYRVTIPDSLHSKLLYASPDMLCERPVNHFRNFRKQFMCIIDNFRTLHFSSYNAWQYRVEINTANGIKFFKQEVAEEPDIKFGIKHFSIAEEGAEAMLTVSGSTEWRTFSEFPSDECDVIARLAQRCADSVHALIVSEIINYREDDALQVDDWFIAAF